MTTPIETEAPCTHCTGSGLSGQRGEACWYCSGTGRTGPTPYAALSRALDALDAATIALDRYGRLQPRTPRHLDLIEAERAAERAALAATRRYLKRPDPST